MKTTILASLVALSFLGYGQKTSSDFVSTWSTKNNSIYLVGNDSTIEIIARDTNFVFNYDVDWNNDGVFDTIGVTGSIVNKYADTGIYTIRIRGEFPRIEWGRPAFYYPDDAAKLLSIDQWGSTEWRRLDGAFVGCQNMLVAAVDTPFLDSLENSSLARMFLATRIDTNIEHWDVSGITDMSGMFEHATDFNQPLEDWDVSSVQNLSSMFKGATDFNQTLNAWDVSSATDLSSMFYGASSFNQPLSDWDVSSVQNMPGMFLEASSFNQPLNDWDISSTVDMKFIFFSASSFNQPLNDWDVSNVTDMTGVFNGATSFNQPLNNWDVSNVKYMINMFANATSFNQPLNDWDVSNVIDMAAMFANATSFNQPLKSWDVAKVKDLRSFLENAASFNQNLGDWDVSTFRTAYLMFKKSGMSTSNYDSTLLGWYNQYAPGIMRLGAEGMKYCLAASARDSLIAKGWQIFGDTIDPNCAVISIEENTKSIQSVFVYPNPSSGSFTIDFDNQSFEGNLEIYNLSGQRVYLQSINSEPKLELNLELAKGMYLLRLSSQNHNATQRLIIQ